MEAGARSAQDTMQHRKRWRRDGGKENRGDNNDDMAYMAWWSDKYIMWWGQEESTI